MHAPRLDPDTPERRAHRTDAREGYWPYRWLYHWNLFWAAGKVDVREYGPLQQKWPLLTAALGAALWIAGLLIGAAVVLHGYSWGW